MVEASKEQQPDVEAEIVDGQVIAEAGQSSVDAGTIATAQEPEPIGENAMSIKKIQGIQGSRSGGTGRHIPVCF